METAFANASDGCFVRSIAHGAAGAPSPMMTADRARAPQRRRVPGIREKREVPLARLLEAGDAADFQRAVAFEPASQPLG